MKLPSFIASLLPHYRALVPHTVRKLVPTSLKLKLAQNIYSDWFGVPEALDSRTSQLLSEALQAFDAQDWKLSAARWQELSTRSKSSELDHSLIRAMHSISSRLSNSEQIQSKIDEYFTLRASLRAPNKVAIYTAIYNDYDSLKLPADLNPNFDYILITNAATKNIGPWQLRHGTGGTTPSRAARFAKLHPHQLLQEFDYAVWIDASVMITGKIDSIVDRFIASGLPIGAIPHSERVSAREEFDACIKLEKDSTNIITKQRCHYEQQLGLNSLPLIESGVMAFNLKHPSCADFLACWWSEIEEFSVRDQLSFGFALHRCQLDFFRLLQNAGGIRGSELFSLMPHDSGNGPAARLLDAVTI